MVESKERVKLILYINQNINICSRDTRISILSLIIQKNGEDSIQTSDHDSLIYFKDLSLETLKLIQSKIEKSLEEDAIDFNDLE
jgi:hypothetical protein